MVALMEATMRGMVLAAVLAVALAGLLTLGGCASEPEHQVWGRLDGQPSTPTQKAQHPQDRAACDYDVTRAAYAGGGGLIAVPSGRFAPGIAVLGSNMVQGSALDSMFYQCMAAKGWRRLQ
jgi:hypothetical protein